MNAEIYIAYNTFKRILGIFDTKIKPLTLLVGIHFLKKSMLYGSKKRI